MNSEGISEDTFARRYDRAASMTAPKQATQLAGRVTDGYWIDHEFFYLAETLIPAVGRAVPLPSIADPAARSIRAVVPPDVLWLLLADAANADATNLYSARFDLPDSNTLGVSIGDQHLLIDRRTHELVPARARSEARPPSLYSADGRYACFIKNQSLWLEDRETGVAHRLIPDEAPSYKYGQQSDTCLAAISYRRRPSPVGLWSPDSRWFLTHRIDEHAVPEMTMVQHAPPDGGGPVSHTLKVALPGEILPKATLVAVHIGSGRVVHFEEAAFLLPNSSPFSFRLVWFDGEECAWFIRRDRYSRTLELIELNLASGNSRVVIRESTESGYLDVNPYVVASPNVRTVSSTGEIIWFSERDGYGHLYLYDARTGALKNQMTRGQWLVRSIVHVDAVQRKLLFLAGGINPDEDPARRSLCSVNFDGSDFRVLLAHEGDIFISPTEPCGLEQDRPFRPRSVSSTPGISVDGRFAVVRYTSADRGNRTELFALETQNSFALASASPGPREISGRHFTVTAADETTLLHGLMFLPPDFSESGRYAVIVYIYPGPQVAHKPQAYRAINAAPAASLAELGFITVVLETRGMPTGSRALHQAGYPALQEPQLADHATAMRQLCRRFAFMDADRLGIIGHSAGGSAAMRALFDYGDLFKVGVAVCGYDDPALCPAAWADKYRGPDRGATEAERPNSTAAHKLTGRLLLISGDLDENVPVSHTLSVASALVRANRDFDLLIVPNETHLLLMTSAYVQRRIWDYFVRHLMGEEPPKCFNLQFEPYELNCFGVRCAQEFRE
jgi:dipeptidyl-peptidase-4